MEIFFGWIILTIVVAIIGSSRKIGGIGAFFVSLILSPLIGLIIVLSSKRKDTEEYEKRMMEMQRKNNSVDQSYQNRMDRLYKLKELLDKGVITDDEFETEKAKILST